MTPDKHVMVPREDGWRYSINYGPEGEANYANVYAPGNVFVGNLRTHHAIAIVSALAAPPAEEKSDGLMAELLTLSRTAAFSEDDYHEMSNWIDDALPRISRAADTIGAQASRLAAAEAEIAALKAEVERKDKALEPFSIMAGELFAQNLNDIDIIYALKAGGKLTTVRARDFYAARRAALQPKEADDGR